MSIFVQWENNKTPLNAENLNVINDVAKQLGEDVAHLSDVVVDIDENFSAKVQNELTEVKSSINTINEATSELQQQTSFNNTNITNIQKTIADNNSALEEKINTNKNNLTTLQSVVNDNKTELDGKITTNKNNLNTLQQNVNNINSTLDNKITVNKNKLNSLEQNINNVNSTLDSKIATNKDNILNIQNSLLTGQYTSYSGTNLTCNDTLSSKTSNMVIKGQTYQNLAKNNFKLFTPDINNNDFDIIINNNSIKITKKTTSITQWCVIKADVNLKLFKSNTDYTLIFGLETNKSQITAKKIGVMNEDGTSPILNIDNAILKNGTNKILIHSNSTTTFSSQTFYVNFLNNSGVENKGDTLTLYEPIILEGDWTNKEVPSSIIGIESVGEKENNKISILSTGKNLFNTSLIKTNINQISDFKNDGNTVTGVFGAQFNTTNSANINIKNKTLVNISGMLKNCRLIISNCWTDTNEFRAILDTQGYTGNETVEKLSSRVCYVDKNSNLRIECPHINGGEFSARDIMVSIKPSNYESYKEDKKEILLPIEGGLKSLPNGVCDTIEQREDGVYLVQRVGKIDLANANYSVSVDSEAGLIVRTKINNIKQLAIDNYICNILVGICNAWDFDYWKDGGFPIAINTENMKNQGQSGLEILVQKRQITSITDVNSFKKYLQDNSAVIYYELETPVETKLDTKDINVETFDGLTYILTNNNIQPELELKIPSNLGALIQNNAKKINELFKLIDELIIPQLTTNTSNIAMLQITK